jgi:hypothetical protein
MNQFKAGSVEGEEQADGSWRTIHWRRCALLGRRRCKSWRGSAPLNGQRRLAFSPHHAAAWGRRAGAVRWWATDDASGANAEIQTTRRLPSLCRFRLRACDRGRQGNGKEGSAPREGLVVVEPLRRLPRARNVGKLEVERFGAKEKVSQMFKS